ncbi:MAG TPA: hypothetical protein VFH73_04565 [Polyangia bacterium]|jgi:hypothetical protein|nr:hypothetical protein [Polyangia bacterium]
MQGSAKENQRLEPLIGEWSMAMVMPGEERPVELPDVGARVTFEWMGDKAFVLERWTVSVPEAPDGLAVIGWDDGRGTFLQHYFDERGVARVYEMSLADGVWKLKRTKPDFSPFEFSQRFTGTLGGDGKRIDGTWEIANDHKTWAKDFDLIYTRVD